ncbi:MAG: LysM peptidoglycan-binding domain-containing protein [Flavobacteriaceae bacterium]|nr:LysM peptidoglycan-binding domain-containing protein [Flavobacteriaceae bacterium]
MLRKTYFAILFVFIIQLSFAQLHTVQKRESITDIARQYNMTPFELFQLNPHAKNGLEEGEVLRVTQVVPLGTQLYDAYKVGRKETLFAIGQKFGISVEDIKKYNPILERNELKNRQILLIPVTYKDMFGSEKASAAITYVVKPKDTKWRVAYLHNMTLEELATLNPGLTEVLKPGEILKVSHPMRTLPTFDADKYDLYEVKPKETLYSLLKKWQISEAALNELNPQLKDGLKAGMMLKIPKQQQEKSFEVFENVAALQSETLNTKPYKLAFMLPFAISKMEADTLFDYKKQFRTDRNLNVVLDFLSGAQMAIDSARALGMNVSYKVYDTENNPEKVAQLIRQNRLETLDALIGPLYQKNVERAGEILKNDKTPVFSPLTNREIQLFQNCFQTVPSQELMEDKMIDFIDAHYTDQNIIIIADRKLQGRAKKIQSKLRESLVITPDTNGLVKPELLRTALAVDKPNWVLLESENLNLISTVVPKLAEFLKDYKITLLTTDRNRFFEGDEVHSSHLARLHFHFPSVDRPYQRDDLNTFAKAYKEKNGISPDKFAVRGFDLTFDVLMRLGSYEDIYESFKENITTSYVENAFSYQKKLLGGFVNRAFYILKYDGYKIIEATP